MIRQCDSGQDVLAVRVAKVRPYVDEPKPGVPSPRNPREGLK